MPETFEKRLSDTLNDMIVSEADLPITEEILERALDLNALRLTPTTWMESDFPEDGEALEEEPVGDEPDTLPDSYPGPERDL